MPQLSFRCSNPSGVEFDRRVAEMASLREARDYAMALVRSRLTTAPAQDWSRCRLYVRDERGEEIFVVPFRSALGRPGIGTRLKAAFARAFALQEAPKSTGGGPAAAASIISSPRFADRPRRP